MSCCGGNCGCGSACNCGSGCGGCSKHPDLGMEGNTSHSTIIFGAASSKGCSGGVEVESGAENGGCKCNTCKCGSNCSCAYCGCN